MAKLDRETRKQLNEALADVKSPFVFFGIDASLASLAERMEGVAGLIDWSIHGQVSRLLAGANFPADGFCLVPGDPANERPSFVAFHFGGPSPDVKTAAEYLRKLGARDVTVAESTFPEDFSRKLKQTLTKEGSSWTKLES